MINYFSDKSFHTTDPKGRLLIPKDIRDTHKIRRSDVLYLVPNLSEPRYLEMRTSRQWEQYRQSLREKATDEKKKDSFRYAKMFKEKVTVDAQGRILIPQQIRDACRLDGTVAFIDMEIYIEVWSKANVEQKYADMVRAFKETNDRMF